MMAATKPNDRSVATTFSFIISAMLYLIMEVRGDVGEYAAQRRESYARFSALAK